MKSPSGKLAETTYALVVGIEKYDNLSEDIWLDGPACDALDFANWLIQKEVSPQNIGLFISPLDKNEHLIQQKNLKDIHKRYDYNTVNDHIREKLLSEYSGGDLLYIFWSSHGCINYKSKTSEKALLTSNYSKNQPYHLSFSLLKLALQKPGLKKGFKKQIYFIDACLNYKDFPDDYEQYRVSFTPKCTQSKGGQHPTNQQYIIWATSQGKTADTTKGKSVFSEELIIELKSSLLLPDVNELVANITKNLEKQGRPIPSVEITDWDGSIKPIGRFPNTQTRIQRNVVDCMINILSPGITEDDFYSSFKNIIENNRIKELIFLNKNVICAIEEGNFIDYVKLGENLRDKFFDIPNLSAQAYYQIGEGYRLQADINIDYSVKTNLNKKAEENFYLALDIEPNMPSCFRGLARIAETNNELGSALNYYDRAIAQTNLYLTENLPEIFKLSYYHEILRLTRHRINCILLMQNSNKFSEWNSQHKINELIGDIVKCENTHTEILQSSNFENSKKWCNLEWFFVEMIFSKVWAKVGEDDYKIIQSLVNAIRARGEIMVKSSGATSQINISDIEFLNLKWWLNTAQSQVKSSDHRNFFKNLDKLETAINSVQPLQLILGHIDDITKPYLSRQIKPLVNLQNKITNKL